MARKKEGTASAAQRNTLQHAIGKLLLDDEFRQMYRREPAETLTRTGFCLTEMEQEALRDIYKNIEDYASSEDLARLRTEMAAHIDEIYVSI